MLRTSALLAIAQSSRDNVNAEQLLTLVRYATLAPSSNNTQPWRFRVATRYVDIVADLGRSLPENDPANRELLISAGCALMNLRLAVMDARLEPHVELFPDGIDAATLARVELLTTSVPDVDRDLMKAMPKRRTYREPFREEPVAADVIGGMESEAAREGAWLSVIDEPAMRREVASLVAEGDRAQWSNPRWRSELARWLRSRGMGDGLTTPLLAVPFARLAVRAHDFGRRFADRDRELAMRAPVLAVLGTYGDTKADWIVAGQSLQRALLWGASRGVQTSFLNQPIQVASLRERLTAVLGVAGFPQVLLRIGHPAKELPATPRRTLDDVTQLLL